MKKTKFENKLKDDNPQPRRFYISFQKKGDPFSYKKRSSSHNIKGSLSKLSRIQEFNKRSMSRWKKNN